MLFQDPRKLSVFPELYEAKTFLEYPFSFSSLVKLDKYYSKINF